jgi:16S rRNA (guanine966-N2)-methyltransferase
MTATFYPRAIIDGGCINNDGIDNICIEIHTAVNKTKAPKTGKATAAQSNRASAAGNGELRIIGGQWRGRKLRFPALPGLRPSPDRVRETLFNWLMPELSGARCLDLFAGSGALGLEALSRGAADCWFIDNSSPASRQIQAHLTTLQCSAGHVITHDARAWLATKSTTTSAATPPFHIVFLDPPFRQGWLNECCALLERGGWLTDHALIYIECGADEQPPLPPSNWLLHRDKRAGQVAYRLFRRTGDAALPLG